MTHPNTRYIIQSAIFIITCKAYGIVEGTKGSD